MRKTQVALVTGLAALVLAGCGGGGGGDNKVASISSPPSTSAAKDVTGNGGKADPEREKQMLQFAKCMRDNGVDMPDPKPGSGGMGVTLAVPGDSAGGADKMSKAQDACKQFLPNGGQPKALSPQELDEARKQAKCMRDHGVDMPDPSPNGRGAIAAPQGGDMAKMEAAMKACGFGDAAMPAAPVEGSK
jgi:hypothetical protein